MRSASGSFAIFAAIRRASSLVSSLAADRRPGSSWKVDVSERLAAARSLAVKHAACYSDSSGRQEATLARVGLGSKMVNCKY